MEIPGPMQYPASIKELFDLNFREVAPCFPRWARRQDRLGEAFDDLKIARCTLGGDDWAIAPIP